MGSSVDESSFGRASSARKRASIARLALYYRRLVQRVDGVAGDFVECGVCSGISFGVFALCFREERQYRRMRGFDSFRGFPEPSRYDTGPKAVRGGCAAGIEEARTTIGTFLGKSRIDDDVTLIEGFFESTLPEYRGGPIALLHLDVDLYESYRCALRHLYPKVAPGGVIAFDEYDGGKDELKWPGARKAIDEFLADSGLTLERDEATSKVFCVRP